MIEFRLLGPLEVASSTAGVVDVGGPQRRALLQLLLLHARSPVGADQLVEGIWGHHPPAQAAAGLQAHISHLRRILDPDRRPGAPSTVLTHRAGRYTLQVSDETIDARVFRRLVEQARTTAEAGDPPTALATYREGLALWRGPAMVEVADEVWARPEVTLLEELRRAAREEAAQIALDLGGETGLIADLEDLVAENPLREGPLGLLMLALYRAGRQADALARHREASETFRDELGIDLGPALRDLEQRILRQDPDLLGPSDRPGAALPPDTAPGGGSTAAAAPSVVDAPPDGPAAGVLGGAGPLVGRAGELAQASVRWQEAMAGHGSVLLVAGEPGIGKTRLLEAVAGLAHAAGGEVRWGRCFESDGAPPFWPWRQVLRDMVEARPAAQLRTELGSGAGEVAVLVPDLAAVLPEVSAPARTDPSQGRFQLHDAVVRFIGRAQEAVPLLVVLDDVHWADPPSLELLRILAEQASRGPLLLAASYRTHEAQRGPLADALSDLARLPRLDRLVLQGLGPDEVGELVAGQVDVEVPDRLVTELHERTAGNPFFLSQLVGLLAQHPGRADAVLALPTVVPDGVRDVVLRRVGGLPPETRRTLEAGAVAGRQFSAAVLARATDRAPLAVLEALDPALQTGIVEDVDGSLGRFRFAHALIPESLVDALSPVRRARLHAQVGVALQELGGEDQLAEVAHHLVEAAGLGLAEEAVAACLAAADRAQSLLAWEQAVDHLGRAVGVLRTFSPDPTIEVDLLGRMAMLLMAIEGYTSPRAAEHAASMLALVEREGLAVDTVMMRYALMLGACVRGEFADSERQAEDLLGLAEATADPVARLAALQARGTARMHMGHLEGSAADLGEVWAALDGPLQEGLLARHLVQVPALVASHLSVVLWLLGRQDEVAGVTAEQRRFAREAATPVELSLAYLNEAWIAAVSGVVDVAVEAARRGLDISEGVRAIQLSAMLRCTLGWGVAVQGAVEEGLGLIDAGLAEMIDSGGLMMQTSFLSLRGDALLRNQRLEDAEATYRHALRVEAEVGERFVGAENRRGLAEVLWRQGGRGPAEDLLEEAESMAHQQGAARLLDRIRATRQELGIGRLAGA